MQGKKCVHEGVELPLNSSTLGTYTGLVDFLKQSRMNHLQNTLLPYMVLVGDTDSKETFAWLR